MGRLYDLLDNIVYNLHRTVKDHNIANNLSTVKEGYVLDARQGVVLKNEIDRKSRELKGEIDEKLPSTGGDISGAINLIKGEPVKFVHPTDPNTYAYLSIDNNGVASWILVSGGVVVNQMTMSGNGFNLKYPLGTANGGTGATNSYDARKNLGAVSMKTTTATLSANGWSGNKQTVQATGVKTSNVIIITADPASYEHYNECAVRCSSQGDGALTFTCTDVPESALTVNVLILE